MAPPLSLGSPLHKRFRLVAFDWDGTAVESRRDVTRAVRGPIERLLESRVPVVVITGTSLSNLDRQLASVIRGAHKRRLYLATNRGSELYGFDRRSRPVSLARRVATPEEDRTLTEIAEDVRRVLTRRTGLAIEIVYDRLNRRKIDLIPLPAWHDPPKSAIPELLRAVENRLVGAGLAGGLREAFRLAEDVAASRGLAGARITSDVKHLEIGLTDKGDALRSVLVRLAEPRGLRPEDILVAGDEFGPIAGLPGSDSRMCISEARGAVFVSVGPEPSGVPDGVLHLGGGPPRFRELLERQAALYPVRLPGRRTRDPAWRIVERGFDLAREHELESLFALGNGAFGTRASLAEGSNLSAPGTYAAGMFQADGSGGGTPGLSALWNWTELHGTFEGARLALDRGKVLEHERTLDLAQGISWRTWRQRDPAGRITAVEGMRLLSLADRHLLFQSVTFRPDNYSGVLGLEWSLPAGAARADPSSPVEAVERLSSGAEVAYAIATWLTAPEGTPIAIQLSTEPGRAVERCAFLAEIGRTYRFDRLVSVSTTRDGPQPAARARARIEERLDEGRTAVVAAHRCAWRRRWRAIDLAVEGDPQAERALRFAAYHLAAAANPADAGVSIGARGLTGPAYNGHVFWDTEIYMLPFFNLTDPAAARALLAYRHRTLPAARARAERLGWRGALYAWESADTGEDVTPSHVLAPDGTVLSVLAGEEEHHISADVAYGVWSYWRASGDDEFLVAAGAEILIETARFWASRVERGADGLLHVRRVMGPDEYHPSVDDDAYTNGMARWNLEQAATTARLIAARWPAEWRRMRERLGVGAEEPDVWAKRAAEIHTGLDRGSRILEQFEGYFDLPDLEPDRAGTPAVQLGPEHLQRTKVVKQASVVLLLYLLWDRFPPDVRERSFRYYEPRTAHGSSLSPPTHAAVAARLGDLAVAERYFRQSAEIDLANNMGNAAGGVHMAALGGLWQAAVFGFAGLDLGGERPVVRPQLPAAWRSLRFGLVWRGRSLRLAVPGPDQPTHAIVEASP
jgi:trehalose/maltose hydrolase-like predicted phosphorylase